MADGRGARHPGLARLVGVEAALGVVGLGTATAVRAVGPVDPLADPAGAVVAGVGLAALGLTLYLAAVVGLALVARLARGPRLHHLAQRGGSPRLRGLVALLIGTAVTVSTAGAAAGRAAAPAARAPVAISGAATPVMTLITGAEPPPVMVQLPWEPAPGPPPDRSPEPAPVPAPAPAIPATWTIGPGDHLWSVARATLAAAHRRPPSDGETLVYVEALAAANRDRFVIPGDADLVRPGQVFVLPPVPA